MIQNSSSFVFLMIYGFSSGLLVSAGVFTVLLAVGLTPRFIGKTHTGKKIFLYESCIMSGAVLGTIFSVIPVMSKAGGWVREEIFHQTLKGVESSPFLRGLDAAGYLFLAAAGLFMGMFVGCLALAIAEMLNSIPIFARRTSYRHGLGLAILSVALGKLAGSLYYFWKGSFLPK